jgi:dTDP-4-amino-4,6-dideoxygalactose transaminase
MIRVPFLDLRAAYIELKGEIDAAISSVIDSGWYILGDEVHLFEKEWADYCGALECVSVGNGLDALRLSLIALGVTAGDEVIVPSNTYIATWLAVSQCGAVPVPVEPKYDDYNIDPANIEKAITSKTKCILAVHLYGHPAPLSEIMRIAKKYSLFVVEDAAQAHGAEYRGQKIGCHGDVVAWSFYPGKNLGAFGDAGAITTMSASIAETIRILRNYGSKVKYENLAKGYNSRMDPIQAAVLRVKLKYLDEWNLRRVVCANIYSSYLSDLPLTLPATHNNSLSAWHLFAILTNERDNLSNYLSDNGISTLIHYPIPPYRQKAYSDLNYSESTSAIADDMSNRLLSLPIGPHLEKEKLLYTANVIRRYFM